MENITQYLLSVTAAAVICGLLTVLVDKNKVIGALVKVLCGLFLTVTVIAPWADVQLDDLAGYLTGLSLEADALAANGEDIAASEAMRIIKPKLEAYILDKADSLGIDLAVCITLDQHAPYLPRAVTLTGSASPYARAALSQYVEENLGIPEDQQKWN